MPHLNCKIHKTNNLGIITRHIFVKQQLLHQEKKLDLNLKRPYVIQSPRESLIFIFFITHYYHKQSVFYYV